MKKPLSGNASSYQEKQSSIFVSFLLGLIGLLMGVTVMVLSNSVTVFSDLLRNISLFVAVLVSWLAVRRVAKGVTPHYNYGYGKLESLSSLVVATMMVISIVIIVYAVIERFQHPASLSGVGVEIGVAFSGIAGIVNAWMWWRNHQIAKRQSSPVIESLWRLYRMKTVSTLCVFLTLGLSLAFRSYSWAVYIDPVGSIAILGFLVFSVYGVISMSMYDLLDRTLDESLQLIILRELATHFEEYVAIHGIRSRRSGGDVYIQILLEFDGDRKMAEVQKVIDEMKFALEQKIPGSQVVIAPTMRY
jgi:cation diffusion facilitator family transporter